MDAYHHLADSYDSLTTDVDYDATVRFYRTLLDREGLCPATAVDLACGTGSVALRLADMGLQVTAVDLSEEMLCVASQKAQDHPNPPVFVCQSLQKLNLPRAVDLAVCALDSLNYIVDPEDCQEAIRRVFRILNPGGCFIFDVNTPCKLRAMDGQVFLDENEDTYCVWRGDFDEESRILTYGMDLFQRSGPLWQRSCEIHQEYAYTQQELCAYLKQAGFTRIEVFGDRVLEAPGEQEQRIYIKARKGRIK